MWLDQKKIRILFIILCNKKHCPSLWVGANIVTNIILKVYKTRASRASIKKKKKSSQLQKGRNSQLVHFLKYWEYQTNLVAGGFNSLCYNLEPCRKQFHVYWLRIIEISFFWNLSNRLCSSALFLIPIFRWHSLNSAFSLTASFMLTRKKVSVLLFLFQVSLCLFNEA